MAGLWMPLDRRDAAEYQPFAGPGMAMVSPSGDVYRYRSLEGCGGREAREWEVWPGSVSDYVAATGDLPVELAPPCWELPAVSEQVAD